MPIATGTRLGAFEVTGKLGVGGMGEVYRATDTRLGRDVAIKTLPSALAEDADRLARLEREAKLLASLNHAHIASVYSLDEHERTLYIAMELVQGETLEDRLKAGPFAVEDALQFGLQIALALEAAHEKGVVHRDLKPANVMVTPDCVIKVLDFGLAKAFSGDPNEASPAHSPALSHAMTQQGLVLGTAGYMSPEQASGQATDQRTDIWAFGVVLYEMLTGFPPFSGESVPHILAEVLRAEPDWSRLPTSLHPRLRLLLKRCLNKKVRNRYHSIADVRVDIEAVLSDPVTAQSELTAPVGAKPGSADVWRRTGLPALVAIVATAAVFTLFFEPRESADARGVPFTFEFAPPAGLTLSVGGWRTPFDISPNARWLAFVASSNGGPRSLWVRDMTTGRIQPVPGTEGASSPFWSPDGESIAFSLANDLYRVDVPNGAPERIGMTRAVGGPSGGSWSVDDRILLEDLGGIYAVAAAGGRPVLVSEAARASPRWLGDGRHFLYAGEDGIYVDSVDRQEPARKILDAAMSGRGRGIGYAPGYLFYVMDDILWVAAFDEARLELTDQPRRLASGVPGRAFSVSSSGVVVYWRHALIQPAAQLVWVDRDGNRLGSVGSATVYDGFDLAPDDSRLVAAHVNETETMLWVHDIAAGSAFPLAFNDGTDTVPIYTSDGAAITFLSTGALEHADATGFVAPITLIADPPGNKLAGSWNSTDDELIYEFWTTNNGIDLIVYHREDERREPVPWNTSANETAARFSPDNQWVAYVSDQSGRSEVWVAAYPAGQPQQQVSVSGGTHPEWSSDGTELYFISSTRQLTAVQFGVSNGPGVPIGQRNELFAMPGPVDVVAGSHNMYKASADGQRFLIAEKVSTDIEPLNVIVNWRQFLQDG